MIGLLKLIWSDINLLVTIVTITLVNHRNIRWTRLFQICDLRVSVTSMVSINGVNLLFIRRVFSIVISANQNESLYLESQ